MFKPKPKSNKVIRDSIKADNPIILNKDILTLALNRNRNEPEKKFVPDRTSKMILGDPRL